MLVRIKKTLYILLPLNKKRRQINGSYIENKVKRSCSSYFTLNKYLCCPFTCSKSVVECINILFYSDSFASVRDRVTVSRESEKLTMRSLAIRQCKCVSVVFNPILLLPILFYLSQYLNITQCSQYLYFSYQ